MAYQFVTIPLTDLGQGIDQLSAENALREGFSEYLLNADPLPEGDLAKRTGYQSFAGQIPFRVSRVEHLAATGPYNLCFYLDSAIDLSLVRSTPIIVHGRADLGAATGDFGSTDLSRYYSSFEADVRKIVVVGTDTITIAQNEHDISSSNIWTGWTQSTSTTDNTNQIVIPDSISVNDTTKLITLTYTNGDSSFDRSFVYTLDSSPEAGRLNQKTGTLSAGINSIAFNAVDHGLANFNIIPKLFIDDGSGTWLEVLPDSFTVASNGDTLTTYNYGGAGTPTYRLDLLAAPAANTKEGTIANDGSPVTVPLTNLETDFLFAGIYLLDTVTPSNPKQLVFPDSIVINAIDKTAAVTFRNNTASDATFQITWESVRVITNKLCVTSHTTLTDASFPSSYESVQLTLWGLLHSESYGDNTASIGARNGWVTHLDSYRSAGEQRLVAGLGGNLFTAKEALELPIRAAYITSGTTDSEIPIHYPNLRTRVNTATTVGPVFFDTTGPTPGRSRGYYRVTAATDGFINATATEYLGNNLVRYTLATPGRVASVATPRISTDGFDRLTINQSGYSINSGEFVITAVDASSPTELLITVRNPNIDSSDYDETGSLMNAGIFTDRFVTSTDCPFIPGDQLLSDLFEETQDFEVIGGASTNCYLRNVTEEFHLDQGLRLTALRTSSIIPLRNLIDNPTVNNVVRGDVLSYSPIERLVKVRSVNPLADVNISIESSSGEATVTLGSENTNGIRLGQKLLLVRAGDFTGVVTVTSIPDSTSFVFSTTLADTIAPVNGVLQGKTVEVDEDLEWQDTTGSTITVGVTRRWMPIEAPDDLFNLTPKEYYRHLDQLEYDEQEFLRSTMVSDNLYLTNGRDRVQKYDGASIYRAGLPRWQPHLFATLSSGSGISYNAISTTTTGSHWTGSYFHASPGTASQFTIGRVIKSSNAQHAGYNFTIVNIDEANDHVYVDQQIPGTAAATTISQRVLYRYYFRLNAVDANNNIIASATVGSEDFRIELSQTTKVNLRLLGLPTFDNYDYDRLEVEIYRTKADGNAPYYKITTLPMTFNNGSGYIFYEDKTSDDTLRDLDATTSALMGAELGTRWAGPLKAKYVTSAGNRLILANLKADPELNISLVKNQAGDNITASNLNNSVFFFKKDNTDTENTIPNTTTRVGYKFTTTAGIAYNQISVSSGIATITTSTNFTGVSPGDWIYIYRKVSSVTNPQKYFGGWHQLEAVSVSTATFRTDVANGSYAGAGDGNDVYIVNTDGYVPVYINDTNTANYDYNYQMVGGNPRFDSIESTATRRLANAINASMRQANTVLYPTFSPWLLANGGDDFGVGQLVVTQPVNSPTTLELKLPTFSGYNIFINNKLRVTDEEVSAFTPSYPSRIIASYPNYPELFENPTAILDTESESAIDINSADGQQITGLIPFFGDTAFGSSLRGGVVVVFKTNSIYLVDLSQKAAGANPVQKLESRGLGCTAPYSIAPSKEGIIFANESGIYKLTRQLTIEYVGRFVERTWKKEVDQDYLPIFHGHYYAIGNRYKLSVVEPGNTAPTKALVYNTVREYNSQAGLGSWTEYDAHNTIGWANLNQDAFWASTTGEVFVLRRTGLKHDYRDDSSPIRMEALLRATNFGDPARRKVVGNVTIDFRVDGQDDQGIQVFSTTDFSDEYEQLDSFVVRTGNDNTNGFDDSPGYRIRSIQFAIKKRRSIYIQTKLVDETIDQSVEIAGISYRVAGLEDSGILEAKDTPNK